LAGQGIGCGLSEKVLNMSFIKKRARKKVSLIITPMAKPFEKTNLIFEVVKRTVKIDYYLHPI
jgi:hypothetical protein